jgi:hypothetical protein
MTVTGDGGTNIVLEKLLEEHGLARDTRLYREATPDTLIPTPTPVCSDFARTAPRASRWSTCMGRGISSKRIR